jgi:dynein heavy chain 2
LLGFHGPVTDYLAEQVESVKHAMPALKFCRGEPFGEEHWAELLQGKLKLGRDVKLANLKVSHFLKALPTLADPATVTYVKQLQARAQGEVTIREALSELRAWSQTAEVKLLAHEEAGRVTPLITGWKDTFLELGDKQSLLSSLKESNFFKAFADQGNVFDAKMAALDSHLHALNQIQRKWVYLEPIFARGALPAEAARFRRVDVEFRDTMGKLERDPKLFNLADAVLFHGLKESLETQLDQLERCQKALAEFLEEKRNAMPRFYFLGDDDLLEILGQAKNPTVIQSHLKKLFQGIHSVQFSEGSAAITAMVSSIGEVVPLDAPVAVTDRVEEWLAALAAEMASTLKLLVGECLRAGSKLGAFPSQVLQVAENVKFADAAEVAMAEGSLGRVKSDLAALLKQYTSMPDPSHLTSNKVKALILDLVHHMDVVDQLVKAGARAPADWAWAKQLRLYAEPRGGVKVKMSTRRSTTRTSTRATRPSWSTRRSPTSAT